MSICPVQAIISFLAVRNPAPGPLFMFQSGRPLTRNSLVTHLQTALREVGVTPSGYTGYSFRIGAATTAAKHGMEDSLIQTLGRWKSAAYLAYIKIPRQELASVSKALAGQPAEYQQNSPRAACGSCTFLPHSLIMYPSHLAYILSSTFPAMRIICS